MNATRKSGPVSGKAGFSLIELLVVVAILVVLTTLFWQHLVPSHRDTALAGCQQNLQRMYIAMEIYTRDYGRRFPAVAGAQTAEEPLDLLVPRYTSDTSVFVCPASRTEPLPSGESIRQRKISYAYYMGYRSSDENPQHALVSDRQIDGKSKNTGDTVFSSTGQPPANNHGKDGGNFLFADGRVEISPPGAVFPLLLTSDIVLLNPKPSTP